MSREKNFSVCYDPIERICSILHINLHCKQDDEFCFFSIPSRTLSIIMASPRTKLSFSFLFIAIPPFLSLPFFFYSSLLLFFFLYTKTQKRSIYICLGFLCHYKYGINVFICALNIKIEKEKLNNFHFIDTLFIIETHLLFYARLA